MKLSYKDILAKLGLERELHVYETQPWLVYDENEGITCEAEIRCNHDKSEIEAELQFMYDKPKKDQRPVEQKCLIKIDRRAHTQNEYSVTSCLIEDKEWGGELYDWETKSCNFFRICIRDIKAGKIPDIEKIRKTEMRDSDRYKKGQGDGSNKSPKINAGQLMYDRKGIGAGF